MNTWRTMAVILLAFGLITGVQAEDKKADANKEKLVGTWEVTKADEGLLPVGAVFAFSKDGKLKATHKQEQAKPVEGSYKVEGDKVTITLKHGDEEKKNTATIKKLTETEVVIEGPDGKTIEFKKKK